MIAPSALLLMLAVAAPQQSQLEYARAVRAVPAQPSAGMVEGRVVSDGDGDPVRAAVVEVVGMPHQFAITDSNGVYNLPEIPAGPHRLRARHLDHRPLEVGLLVVPNDTINLEFELELRPVPLPTLHVVHRKILPGMDSISPPGITNSPAPDELRASTVSSLAASPGVAELGLADAIPNEHGSEPPDPSDILYVRGATADLKSVYLDGAPVYAPVHLGGVMEAFHTGVLNGATLHTGGSSARYDGGLSYVLDLETRSGRSGRIRSSGALDLSSARGLAEGSLNDRVNVLVAARGVHGQATELWTGDEAPSGYREFLGRFDAAAGRTGQLGGTIFWNRETVLLSPSSANRPAHWGNMAGSLRLRGDIPMGEGMVTASVGRFQTRLPFAGEELLVVEGYSNRQRIAADATHHTDSGDLDYGASFERLRLSHGALSIAEGPPAERIESEFEADLYGAYIVLQHVPTPALRIKGGLRANLFVAEESKSRATRFSPRLSMTWVATDRAILTLGIGRYHQYVQNGENFASPDEIALFELPEDETERIPSALGVGGATHLVLDLEQAFDHGIRLGLQGFYKSYETVPSVDRPQVEASGVDLWLRREGAMFDASFGYSHGWMWAVQDSSLGSSVFAGRHLLDGGVALRIGSRNEASIRATYATGLPYTAIPHLGGEPTEVTHAAAFGWPALEEDSEDATRTDLPRGSYLRLEGEVARTWIWRPGTRASSELTAYLRLLNGLDRRDALFVRRDPDAEGLFTSTSSLPLLPILGVRWSF